MAGALPSPSIAVLPTLLNTGRCVHFNTHDESEGPELKTFSDFLRNVRRKHHTADHSPHGVGAAPSPPLTRAHRSWPFRRLFPPWGGLSPCQTRALPTRLVPLRAPQHPCLWPLVCLKDAALSVSFQAAARKPEQASPLTAASLPPGSAHTEQPRPPLTGRPPTSSLNPCSSFQPSHKEIPTASSPASLCYWSECPSVHLSINPSPSMCQSLFENLSVQR